MIILSISGHASSTPLARKTGDITDYITRELEWSRDALSAARLS
jgi:hypothetical protein